MICTRRLTSDSTATGNTFTNAGYTAFIHAAVNAAKATDPKKACGWVTDIAHMIPAASLADALLPRELEGNAEGIRAYLRQIHGGGHRRATLVLVGPPRVGKSSLLWRMQNLKATKGSMPKRGVTHGIDTGKAAAATAHPP